MLLSRSALRQLERGRTWAAAAVLALAGLVRETSVLCGGGLLAARPTPAATDPAARRRALLASLVCLGPIAVWMAILVGPTTAASAACSNLAPPLSASAGKARELADGWRTRGFDVAVRDEILIAATLAVQIGF